jgi:hypothetical protein
MKKVIIAGGRNFTDYEYLKEKCLEIITEPCEIVSGGSKGADFLGEKFSKEMRFQVKRFPANWNLHDKVKEPFHVSTTGFCLIS